MFGAGKLLDVYLAAFQIPNLLRDLFAEGALSVAFTTLFTRAWDKEGPAPAWALANLILSAMIFLMGIWYIVAWAWPRRRCWSKRPTSASTMCRGSSSWPCS